MMLEFLLWTIASVLIVAFSAAVIMLCTPMRISVMFDTQARPKFLVKVALFGVLLPVMSTADKRQKRPTDQRTKSTSHKSRTPGRRSVATFVPRMLRETPGLISKIVSRVKLESLDAKFRFGLLDPADTGIVYGALIPIMQIIGVSDRSNIVLHPDFGDEVFDGRGQMGARFVPIALIAPMLSFAWATMVLPRLLGMFR